MLILDNKIVLYVKNPAWKSALIHKLVKKKAMLIADSVVALSCNNLCNSMELGHYYCIGNGFIAIFIKAWAEHFKKLILQTM